MSAKPLVPKTGNGWPKPDWVPGRRKRTPSNRRLTSQLHRRGPREGPKRWSFLRLTGVVAFALTPALSPGGSPCPTSYLLDTVGSDTSFRKPMTTNQLSLLRTPIVRVTQFRQHLVWRRAGAGLMPCPFASLRLCVIKGVGSNAKTQRRREDVAKRRLIGSVGRARSPRTGARDC